MMKGSFLARKVIAETDKAAREMLYRAMKERDHFEMVAYSFEDGSILDRREEMFIPYAYAWARRFYDPRQMFIQIDVVAKDGSHMICQYYDAILDAWVEPISGEAWTWEGKEYKA